MISIKQLKLIHNMLMPIIGVEFHNLNPVTLMKQWMISKKV